MPRGLKDRPEIIPDGSRNLALIGQFVELEGDVVFTVETSIRNGYDRRIQNAGTRQAYYTII